MGFVSARSRQQSEPDAGPDHSLMCRMSGCRSRWTVDILHGRVCSLHDDALSRVSRPKPTAIPRALGTPVPFHDAVRPFIEPSDREEEFE